MVQWQLIVFGVASVIGLILILAQFLGAISDWLTPSPKHGPGRYGRTYGRAHELDALHRFISPYRPLANMFLVGGPGDTPPLWMLIAVWLLDQVSGSGTPQTASSATFQISMPHITQDQAHIALIAAGAIVAILLAWVTMRALLALVGRIKITLGGILWIIGELTAIATFIIGHYWK